MGRQVADIVETEIADLRAQLRQLSETLDAAALCMDAGEMEAHLEECQALAGDVARDCRDASHSAAEVQADHDAFEAHIRALIAASGHSIKVVQGE